MTQEIIEKLRELDSSSLLNVISASFTKLTSTDLKSLELDVKERAAKLKPYRLKIGFRKCNKKSCYCQHVELQDAHGPYITLCYRDGSKNIRESLGKAQYQDDIRKLARLPYPDELDFICSPDEPGASRHVLTDMQYQKRYSIAKGENTSLTISLEDFIYYSWQAYNDEFSKVIKMREIALSRWARFGIASPDSIEKLERIERRGYYLKEANKTIEQLEDERD